MSTEKTIKEAVALKELGFSLREIAEQLGTSKSTVDRWLKSYDSSSPNDEHDEFQDEDETPVKRPRAVSDTVPGQGKTNADLDLGRLKLQYQHSENIFDKQIKMRLITMKERQQELQDKLVSAKEEAIFIKNNRLEKKYEGRKKTLMSRFHRLIKTLNETCTEYYWDTDETESYLAKVEKLKEEIEDFCDNHAMDYEELAIWNYLDTVEDWIIDLIEKYQEKLFKNGNIYFDFDDEDIEQLEEALQIQSFEDVWEEIEDDEDEDSVEDEDFDEENDMEDEDEFDEDENEN